MMPLINLLRLYETPEGAGLITTQEEVGVGPGEVKSASLLTLSCLQDS